MAHTAQLAQQNSLNRHHEAESDEKKWVLQNEANDRMKTKGLTEKIPQKALSKAC
jgi:hypothetical protein